MGNYFPASEPPDMRELYNFLGQYWSRALYFGEVPSHFFWPSELVESDREVPPVRLWGNLVLTGYICSLVRNHFDSPLTITSGYRDPAYNQKVGGTPRSMHILGKAADIKVGGHSPEEVYDFLDGHEIREQIALGIYNSFVHVDHRHWDFPVPDPIRWDMR